MIAFLFGALSFYLLLAGRIAYALARNTYPDNLRRWAWVLRIALGWPVSLWREWV